MSYAVLLYFDPRSEAIIHDLMKSLSTQVNVGDLLPKGFRPHLTLTGFEDPPTNYFIDSLKRFAIETPPIPISLAAVGAFPTDDGVVYLAPVVTNDLLALHQNFYRILDNSGIKGNPHFTPGNWIPHCSIAYGLNPKDTGYAIEIILDEELPISGELITMGLTKFLPIEDLCIFQLTRGSQTRKKEYLE